MKVNQVATDSTLWSVSFLPQMQRSFDSWGTKRGQSVSQLRLDEGIASGQRRDSPTSNQLKCVLLCLCSDWEKHSGEN